MILEALVALCQEPWCFAPSQIAQLTDWQVLNLYLKPAAERSEKMREESGMPAPPAPPSTPGAAPEMPARKPRRKENNAPVGEPGTEVHRRQIVEQAFMGVMGMKRAQAEALYEKQLAEWHEMQARGEV